MVIKKKKKYFYFFQKLLDLFLIGLIRLLCSPHDMREASLTLIVIGGGWPVWPRVNLFCYWLEIG